MAGYTVVEAVDGEEALDVFLGRGQIIDLVVLDLDMPVMGGRACLSEILRCDGMARVIMVIESPDRETRDELRALGALGFVTKPFASAELLREVGRVLGTAAKDGAQPCPEQG
jgi:DNA-binding response OmpR family regulator